MTTSISSEALEIILKIYGKGKLKKDSKQKNRPLSLLGAENIAFPLNVSNRRTYGLTFVILE